MRKVEWMNQYEQKRREEEERAKLAASLKPGQTLPPYALHLMNQMICV